MSADLYIGTSGWHYNDWIGTFYPAAITGYNELRYHSQYFNSVENNSSFYRVAQASTYKTWSRMTPEEYKFSMKLNKLITHTHRLELTDEVRATIDYILTTTQVLQARLGAIDIQLPPSFRVDMLKLDAFLNFFMSRVAKQTHTFDVAIEFRNMDWFCADVYGLLRKYNVALVTSQSSRYPEVKEITANIAYIRMHGPEKLFASTYSHTQLKDWATYIRSIVPDVERVYVYFNNDFHGFALDNAKELKRILASR